MFQFVKMVNMEMKTPEFVLLVIMVVLTVIISKKSQVMELFIGYIAVSNV